jgi:hypothetical protein
MNPLKCCHRDQLIELKYLVGGPERIDQQRTTGAQFG